MADKDVKATDAKSGDGASASQAGDDASSQGGTDWKKAHDGQLARVRTLETENTQLREQAKVTSQLSTTVAGLVRSVEGIEVAQAETVDAIRSFGSRSGDSDIYGGDPETDNDRPSTSQADQVRSRIAARRTGTFVEEINRQHSAITAAYAQDPTILENADYKAVLADYNAARNSNDPRTIPMLERSLDFAKRSHALTKQTAGDASGDGSDPNNDAANSDSEGDVNADKEPDPSKREALSKSGLMSEQSGGGSAAQTDQYADASPTELFKAAGRGEGPKRS